MENPQEAIDYYRSTEVNYWLSFRVIDPTKEQKHIASWRKMLERQRSLWWRHYLLQTTPAGGCLQSGSA
jgi:hypothetical protein